MMRPNTALFFSALALGLFSNSALAAKTQITFLYSDDDPELVHFMEQKVKSFSQSNERIDVNFVSTGYNALQTQLPMQLAAGLGPDIAKTTQMGLLGYTLDLRPYLKDPAAFEKRYNAGIEKIMRVKGVHKADALPGFVASWTADLPFINVTLFEQAGVPIPQPGYTIDDLMKASKLVAEKTGVHIPFTIDRSGFRFSGPAYSYGARYDKDGLINFPDAAAQLWIKDLKRWSDEGVFPREMWGAAGGGQYKSMADDFVNGNIVTYFSGNWLLNQFSKQIGDGFDWKVLPAPCKEKCISMGGATFIMPFTTTKHPQEVAEFMEWLGSEPLQREIAEHFNIIVGADIADLHYQTKDKHVIDGLNTAREEIKKIPSYVFDWERMESLGANELYPIILTRFTQYLNDQVSFDEYLRLTSNDVKRLNETIATNQQQRKNAP
ncbi:ABC transporter substrate-binding protein [Pectobacterium atrosepticum]|uniref:ABC transporter substrate-binding protein n=1 Tax=Pectobacterium atrosepticum TaxID=29471 RepID=UPI00049A0CA0|nr:ABC transporter substrate-binding protein [Pectobacterium atrosepticum]AIA72489.1 sugar ABC transporter substrate-binding protein [Pectobacterium atrosepticum]AIK15469.1 putative rhamnogalacturonides ABC transporter, substrate-binding protein [Pectobacterium atrosepticum]POW28236.1 sugar ABC transporter substrate-binding protein [Pectobacterium atrosepticum]PWD56898.1 carbohydrate ABC transporter substrate-binding protein [Pectobacterium atrosepticum]